MRVRQENGLERQSLLLQGGESFGVCRGVDDDGAGAAVLPDEIAVGGQRAQRERLNVHSVSLFEIVRVDDQGDQPVVFRRDLHIRAEFAVLRREAEAFALGEELLVERDGRSGFAAPMKLGRRPWLTSP